MARKAVEAKQEETSAPQAGEVNTSFEELKKDVLRIFEESITIPEAERLAAKFLYAQMIVSEEIKGADLECRLKKAGVKTMSSKVYLDEVAKHEKKPSDTLLDNIVATNAEVNTNQDLFDRAQVHLEALKRLFEMLRDAHIFCRGIAKGSYDG